MRASMCVCAHSHVPQRGERETETNIESQRKIRTKRQSEGQRETRKDIQTEVRDRLGEAGFRLSCSKPHHNHSLRTKVVCPPCCCLCWHCCPSRRGTTRDPPPDGRVAELPLSPRRLCREPSARLWSCPWVHTGPASWAPPKALGCPPQKQPLEDVPPKRLSHREKHLLPFIPVTNSSTGRGAVCQLGEPGEPASWRQEPGGERISPSCPPGCSAGGRCPWWWPRPWAEGSGLRWGLAGPVRSLLKVSGQVRLCTLQRKTAEGCR